MKGLSRLAVLIQDVTKGGTNETVHLVSELDRLERKSAVLSWIRTGASRTRVG